MSVQLSNKKANDPLQTHVSRSKVVRTESSFKLLLNLSFLLNILLLGELPEQLKSNFTFYIK